jgi:hypothetical protein
MSNLETVQAYTLVLQTMSYPLSSFFGSRPISFPSKLMSCRLNHDLICLGPRPLSKGLGTNLKLLTNSNARFHGPFSLDLCLKWQLLSTRRKPQTIRLYTTLSSLNFIHVLSRLENIKHAVSKLNSTNVVGGHPNHKRFCDIFNGPKAWKAHNWGFLVLFHVSHLGQTKNLSLGKEMDGL